MYSIIGATAMTTSVTKTLSVAVIILELNGHLSHAVPVMIAVITSYIISEIIYPFSFFEILSLFNGVNDKIIKKGKI